MMLSGLSEAASLALSSLFPPAAAAAARSPTRLDLIMAAGECFSSAWLSRDSPTVDLLLLSVSPLPTPPGSGGGPVGLLPMPLAHLATMMLLLLLAASGP